MARRDGIGGPLTRVVPLTDTETTATGIPDGYQPVVQPVFTQRTVVRDLQDAIRNLHKLQLWHKGLHADLLDGHHASDFQPICDFLTELCEDEDAAIDHGSIGGLADDDHTQYMLGSGTVVDNTIPVYVGTGGRDLEDTPVSIDPLTGNTQGIADLDITGTLLALDGQFTTDLRVGADFLFGDLGGGDWLIESDVTGNGITIGNASTKVDIPGTLDPKAFGFTPTAAAGIPVPATGMKYLFVDLSGNYQVKDDANNVTALKAGLGLTKADVGLSSADDVSDAGKPVSTAMQTALDAKAATNRKLDDFGAPDDNTDLNVSTGAHGLCPKLPNDAAVFLDGTGAYSAPSVDEGAIADAVAAYLLLNPPDVSAAWPVGSIFFAAVGTDPATLLGFGTWAVFGAGKVCVGIDSGDTDFDTLEETRGAKTVTLTAAQSGVPAHTHTQDAHGHTQNAHTHDFLPRSSTSGSVSSIVTGTLDTSSTISGANQPHVQSAVAVNQTTVAVNQNNTPANAAEAHSNIQPSIVVAMWKRTA